MLFTISIDVSFFYIVIKNYKNETQNNIEASGARAQAYDYKHKGLRIWLPLEEMKYLMF